jgi:hypothetical protein
MSVERPFVTLGSRLVTRHASRRAPARTVGADTNPRNVMIALLALAATVALQPADSTWRDHNAASEAAAARGDWTTARRHMQKLDTLLNGHPAVVLALARAAVRLGERGEALALLGAYADMGLGRDVTGDSAFVTLRGEPGWNAIGERLRANRAPVGKIDTAFALADPEFIPEDLAYDAARRRFIVSSVRRRRLVAVDARGRSSAFAASDTGLDWSALAVAVDAARGRVWTTIEPLPHGDRAPAPADTGRAAVLRFDMAGRLARRYDVTPDGARHELGDATLAPNGDLYVADGRAGALYVVRADGDAIERLVAPGPFASPQQPALSPDGRTLYVADYTKGIALVEPRTGAVSWLAHARGVALSGIDGLIARRAADGSTRLIAVQNGVTPNRVIELTLDAPGRAVRSWRTLLQHPDVLTEPTHGVIVGDDLYVIANSNWGKFGRNGEPPAAGTAIAPPLVLRVRLDR